MGDALTTGPQLDALDDGSFIVYADFNCPFCYAFNERLNAMNLEHRVEFRSIQHAPLISSDQVDAGALTEIANEVAEVRRRSPSTRINVPLFRPNTALASALVNALSKSAAGRAESLRRRLYRALWVDSTDISDPGMLRQLLFELDIEMPSDEALADKAFSEWQQEWESNPEFDRSLPVVISAKGETMAGFPLEPEVDSFLNSGSMVSEKVMLPDSFSVPLQRILMLDDDLESLQLILAQMRGVQVEIASTFSALIKSAVNYGVPDLVLVNTRLLGGIDSTDWWRNSTDSDLAVPVIFISDDKSSEAELSAFEAGAADFISKPFHAKVLQARLNMHLQARRSQQQLNNMARIDALTSICNRREFDYRLMTEWGRGARSEQPLALLMIDVDHFKQYNDHYGHLRGDDCLVAVAKILTSSMQRSGDLVARYGGEEFVVLLPEAEVTGALKVAEACLVNINDADLEHEKSGVADHVTISIGVASMMPIHERSSTMLIEQADIALYQAKQGGRNQVCVFEY